MTIFSVGILAALTLAPHLQNPAHDLDFWVGSWKCQGEMTSPTGQKTPTSATNHVVRILDAHVIQENFRMKGLNGMSVSAYDPNRKMWHQTWVDNGGAYIALNGAFSDGQMILSTQASPRGGIQRMVFSAITANSFDWNWQGSKDGGKTWRTQWHLHYTRVAA